MMCVCENVIAVGLLFIFHNWISQIKKPSPIAVIRDFLCELNTV